MVRDVLGRLAEDDRLDDRVHVDAVGERLTDALVREGGRALDLHRVNDLHVGEVLRLDRSEGDLAGLEAVRDRGLVGDHLVDVLIDIGDALPVGLVLVHDDLIALAPLGELEGSAEDGRSGVLRRRVDLVLRGVGHVLAEDLCRQRLDRVEVKDRRAGDFRHRDCDLLGVRAVDLDPRDRVRLAVGVILEALDVLVVRLADGLLALADRLDRRDDVFTDHRLPVRPVGLRVQLERVGEAVARLREGGHPRLRLAVLRILDQQRVVDQVDHPRRRGVVGEDRLHRRDVRDRGFNDSSTLLRLLRCRRRRARRGRTW